MDEGCFETSKNVREKVNLERIKDIKEVVCFNDRRNCLKCVCVCLGWNNHMNGVHVPWKCFISSSSR